MKQLARPISAAALFAIGALLSTGALLLAGALAVEPAAAQRANLPPLPQLLTPRQISPMPSAKPTRVVHYGPHPSQVAELYLPPAKAGADSKRPVVVLIHGGCFRNAAGGFTWVRPAATALSDKGYAVWSIDYREADEEGGGYPGTYQDVAKAIDLLREQAAEQNLDLDRVVLFGHSAGGQMALWAAGRGHLPADSPLRTATPLKPRGVLSFGGYGSLARFDSDISSRCGAEIMSKMLPPATPGTPPAEDPRFADTSPDRLLPTGVPTVLLHGVFDSFAPPAAGLVYVESARKAGDRSEIEVAPVAGHFEGVAPGTPMFAQAVAAIERLAR